VAGKLIKFVGLAVARWEADFASLEAKQAVQADLREAEQLGVNAVPTLIFNQRWDSAWGSARKHAAPNTLKTCWKGKNRLIVNFRI